MQPLDWVHALLNLVGLLLWLMWREDSLRASRRPVGTKLLSTLKRAGGDSVSRWIYLGSLAGLLLVRAFGYWQMGRGVRWTPLINLCVVVVPFRSDLFARMLVFSTASLAVFVAEFYFWLLLLSAANRRVLDTDPVQNHIRAHLGRVDRWPGFLKLLLPFLLAGLLWLGVGPLMAKLGYQLPAKSLAHAAQQAVLVGLSAFLVWKYLIAGILLLHLVSSYVYFGQAPAWTFLNVTARNLLRPIAWMRFLQFGKIDLTPLAGAALVLGLGEAGARGLPTLYRQLPL
ncbi:MAG: hypothetical protein HZA90_19480 [Verrucomicrobia bacterium]|nr:hypothetical protein [Verrucomicrobiota bacterium]